MEKLEQIFEFQKEFGSRFIDFDKLNEEQQELKTLEFIDHCIEELIEMRKEIPRRKHWKKLTPVDKVKLLDEYVDVLHFFIELAIINGWTAETIYQGYLDKNKVNHQRQENGY